MNIFCFFLLSRYFLLSGCNNHVSEHGINFDNSLTSQLLAPTMKPSVTTYH